MASAFTLEGSNILFGGNPKLTQKKVNELLSKAIRRKMRLEGYDAEFRRCLNETGNATLTWHFTRHNHAGERYWVNINAHQLSKDVFAVSCEGPAAKYTVERINKAIIEPQCAKRKRARQALQRIRNRKLATRNKRQIKNRAKCVPIQVKKKRYPTNAPLSLKTKIRVYKSSLVTWKEAVTAVAKIFGVRDGWKYYTDKDTAWRYSSEQLAARELFSSFDNSGHRFMRMRREGFELRFDILDHDEDRDWTLGPLQAQFFDTLPQLKKRHEDIWERLEMTRFTISCSKGDSHPLYKRMRRHFKALLVGLPTSKARERRAFMQHIREAA